MFTDYPPHNAKDKAAKIQSVLEAFVHQGRQPTTYDDCPVWVDEQGNLWFKSVKYKGPSLLAVWGRDDVINLRKSQSEASHVGDAGHDWVARVQLRVELEKIATRAGYKYDYVTKLSERKAEEALMTRITKGI